MKCLAYLQIVSGPGSPDMMGIHLSYADNPRYLWS